MATKDAGQQLRVSKFCESEMATKDTHLVLWSTRATPGISASVIYKTINLQDFWMAERDNAHHIYTYIVLFSVSMHWYVY
jgi:hypothetical protein